MSQPIGSTKQAWPWSLEIRIERIFNNLIKQDKKLGSDLFCNSQQHCPWATVQSPESRVQRLESSAQSPEPSVQSPASRVQSPASRAQNPESSIQSPPPRVQRPESSVQLLRQESRNSGMALRKYLGFQWKTL